MKQLLALLVLVGCCAAAFAQEPRAVNAALAELNRQTGQAYGFDDIYYFYSEKISSSNNLDCPTLPTHFAFETNYYEVQFDTDGNGQYEWEIRVTSDARRIIVCRSPLVSTPIPVTPALNFSTLIPFSVDGAFNLQTVGTFDAPFTSTDFRFIDGETLVTVDEGVFSAWKPQDVFASSLIFSTFYLPNPADTSLDPTLFQLPEGALAGKFDKTNENVFTVMPRSVALYNRVDTTRPLMIVPLEFTPDDAFALSADNTRFAVECVGGMVHLFQFNGSTYVEVSRLSTNANVHDLEFISNGGGITALVGNEGDAASYGLWLWGLNDRKEFYALNEDLGAPTMAFNPDQRLLVISSDTAPVRVLGMVQP